MRTRFFAAIFFGLVVLSLSGESSSAADIDSLQRTFAQPPEDARIMARWWWFGPAVVKPELERELRTMKEGGFGGVEVQTTYPLSLDDPAAGITNLKFLSPEHLDAIQFTAAKAKELGLRMDLTLGSGWPYGGPMFSASEAAGRIQSRSVSFQSGATRVPIPSLRDGEKVISAYLGPVDGPENPFIEVPVRDGAAQLPSDTHGQSSVTFCVASQTRMMVKRPANGAEGFVIDHYSPTVIEKFMKEIADPAVQACGDNPPYAVFCDSLEVVGEDWTPRFLDEFKKRRGYDLEPLLPALFSTRVPRAVDIRHDWGQTLTEVFNDYFVAAFEKYAKEHNTQFRIQAYGTPPAALYSYAQADLPEGEGYTWKGFRETRWASSASHLLGKPVTSSETFTWLHSPVFMASPLDMKAEADLHFLQGVNQIVVHGWPYTAPGVEYPGWRFYAAAVFDEKNPWWIVMPDVTKYLQRTSAMLRQGQPANDVALYLANDDAWSDFVPGKVAFNTAVSARLGPRIISDILQSGYNLDFFDDGMLDLRGKVEKGALVFGEVKYKAVVLAGVERMPVSTLLKLEEFAKGGGILIATRRLPAGAAGYMTKAAVQEQVHEIVQQLFQGPGAKGIWVEDESQFGSALAKKLSPDLALSPASPDVGFVHRHTDPGEVYFVANTANTPASVKASFRVTGMQPELWNPFTAEVSPMQVASDEASGTRVSLDLPAYGSCFVVFDQRKLSQPAVSQVAAAPAVVDLSVGWKVTFGTNQNPVQMDSLKSWTDDEATRFFSGTAVYEKSVSVPAELVRQGLKVRLDFGEGKPTSGQSQHYQAFLDQPVQVAAVVYVNGQRAGSVWCPPYAVDVTQLLKAGDNQIRVEVANLAVNYMAGHPLPDYRALTAKYGERFQAQDMNQIRPIPSGLTGPIKLVATADGK